MRKIASFTVNHLDLEPGIYVSRVDHVGDQVITTFDLRFTTPNKEPVMGTAEIHTIEHLGATYLRNDPTWADRIIYFGPMGCRTGFYLILAGELASADIVDLMTDCMRFIIGFEGQIPGATARDCGNYQDQNLDFAKYYARRWLGGTLEVIDDAHMTYPA